MNPGRVRSNPSDLNDLALETSDVVLVVIGPGWPRIGGSSEHDHSSEDEIVQAQVSRAFNLGKLVVPVLVQGMVMPAPDEMPHVLGLLSGRKAVMVTDDNFDQEVTALAEEIRRQFLCDAGGGHVWPSPPVATSGREVPAAVLPMDSAPWRGFPSTPDDDFIPDRVTVRSSRLEVDAPASEVSASVPARARSIRRRTRSASERKVSTEFHQQVRNALADIAPGRAAFNPPSKMRQGRAARVEVRIARGLLLDAELLRDLTGNATVTLTDLRTSVIMAVELRGSSFEITPFSDTEQVLTDDEITKWEFDIRALHRGRQRLTVVISLRLPIAGTDRRRAVPSLERTVDVHVSIPYCTARFIRGNWQWIVGTAAGLGAAIAAWTSLL
jgi:hypothetical protein